MQNENNYGQEDNLEMNKEKEEVKPIIEIPQAYYDKLKQEQLEKERIEKEKEEQIKREKELKNNNSSLLGKILLNMVVIFGSLYGAVNKNPYLLAIIPAYILILSIFFAVKKNKKSDFAISILLGGILLAILCFLVCLVNEDTADLWMYFTVASIASGFIGLITANVLTWFITERKNIKALQTMGFFLYFVLLVGIPYAVYKKFPEEFTKIVFRSQSEVKAETQQEFIEKTLKNRYGEKFTCNEGKNAFLEGSTIYGNNKQLINLRTCTNEQGTEINVQTTEYDKAKVLYVVTDDYIEIRYLKTFKETLERNLKTQARANVSVRLYPETQCNFVGDCADCEAYYAYRKELDSQKLYEYSSKLNLENYLKYTNATDFVNEYQFKYIINVIGSFGGIMSTEYDEIVDNILASLNDAGLKNTYGYEITLKNSNELNKIVYKVTGDTNEEKKFKDPIMVE